MTIKFGLKTINSILIISNFAFFIGMFWVISCDVIHNAYLNYERSSLAKSLIFLSPNNMFFNYDYCNLNEYDSDIRNSIEYQHNINSTHCKVYQKLLAEQLSLHEFFQDKFSLYDNPVSE